MILTAEIALGLDLTAPITGTRTYRALQTITAQYNFVVASGGDVTFIAGQRIELKPGFHAQSGSQFHAQIDPNIGSQPGNVLSFTYNQKGERIKKHSDSNGTLYYIRGVDGQTLALLSETDTPLFYNIADVGRLVPGANGSSYYYLTDHLGSIRVIVDESGNVVGYTDYYPFGMAMPGREMTSLSEDFYKYNAKQLDDDYGLNWLDYGWRPYDAEIGRWVRVDPLQEYASGYVYVGNNPTLLIDPTGLATYIDSLGNVLFIDDKGTEIYQLDVGKDYKGDFTPEKGKLVGRTLHIASFANQKIYENTGKLVVAEGAKIDIGSTWAKDIIIRSLDEVGQNFLQYALNAGSGEKYDIKVTQSPGGVYYGSQISEGVYVSARDAGNILAGAAAWQEGFTYNFAMSGFGALQLGGNSKLKALWILIKNNLDLSHIPNFGETVVSHFMQSYGYNKFRSPNFRRKIIDIDPTRY